MTAAPFFAIYLAIAGIQFGMMRCFATEKGWLPWTTSHPARTAASTRWSFGEPPSSSENPEPARLDVAKK